MAIVTAEESRAGSRDLYVPPHERGMAHRSYPSPDGKSILVVEMNERGAFGPCRLVSAEGNSQGRHVGSPVDPARDDMQPLSLAWEEHCRPPPTEEKWSHWPN